MKKYKEVLKVVGKELGRWVVVAVIPATIAYLTELDAEFALYTVALLRLVDKVLHDSYKTLKIEKKGLLPF